MRVERRYL